MGEDLEKEVLRQELINLTERVQLISERENEHYSEIMLLLREVLETLTEKIEASQGLSEDELVGEAEELVRDTGKVSTSFLQRSLGIGYARAASLVDKLEEKGVIGPADGAKPRKVLM